ncbi:MAG TPA: hypothetical protein VK208_12260 [Pyrinomonadaceae bacterium]|nr:hypothetical protein [Pyrinomonadaceae bacterium]
MNLSNRLRYGRVLLLNQAMLKTIIPICLVVFLFTGCSKNSGTVESNSKAGQSSRTSAESAQNTDGEFRTKAPDGWVVEKPTSEMRFAQYKLPKAEGDAEDAFLVVYYFGKGQGGTTEANIERWINQVKQPDGSPSKDKAKTETSTVNGLPVTTVDVVGTYSGGMSQESSTHDPSLIYRLRGAVVETPKGSYFVKLTGPQKTVNRWDQAYNDYVKSFEFK